MILEIHSLDGAYIKTVMGDEAQCRANIGEGEVGTEVEALSAQPLSEESYAEYMQYIGKQNKITSVSKICVATASGKIFDGDETSQERILRAINIASITGQTSTEWKMADNSIVEVTLEELKEALALSGQEMSRIWLS